MNNHRIEIKRGNRSGESVTKTTERCFGEGCQKKSLLLTTLERSAVATATSRTGNWYLEQRSGGIAAEYLMFGTHLGSTNTSRLLFPARAFSLMHCPRLHYGPRHPLVSRDHRQSSFIASRLFSISHGSYGRLACASRCFRC